MSDALSYLVSETAKAVGTLLQTIEEIAESLKKINLEHLAENREDLVTDIHSMVNSLQGPMAIVNMTLMVAAAMCDTTGEDDEV